MDLLARADNDEQLKALLTATWNQFVSQSPQFEESQGEAIINNILHKNITNKPVSFSSHKRSLDGSWITAVAVFCCSIIGIYFWLQPKHTVQQITQFKRAVRVIRDSIMPGSNKALLTLSDGSAIELDSTRIGTLVKQGNAKVINSGAATLAYKAGNENNEAVVYNTLSTFRGGQYHLVLSDGTGVWLNASSSINYPTIFRGSERKVTVTGEVYFEVSKNKAVPFNITVQDLQVQVLGTHFNIMAYHDENSVNTTLLEGSVKISNGTLTRTLAPGQESRAYKTGSIKVVEADDEEVMAWKNGWFQFNAYDIEKVMRQVSRWYDVEIAYEGTISKGHFSGMISRQNNILQVLKILEGGGVGFKIEGRKVIVYSDKLNL